MNDRIDHASAATAASERHIDSVQNLLQRVRPCNSFGVYMDRIMVMADLNAARRDIDAAWNALNTDWPEAADYRKV
jgi:hypothetical protein